MNGIQSETLRALEWNRITSLAQTEARSEPGKTRIRRLEDPANWARTASEAQVLQSETQEMVALLDRDALWGPLTGLNDPEPALELLDRSGTPEIPDLVLLRGWLYASDTWVQTPRDEIRGERFKKALQTLPDPYEGLRVLERVLTPEGELSEKASPRLASLYSEIRALKGEIAQTLDHLLKTLSQRGVLQENFTDLRDGRYVLPIKIDSQNEVEGIIYEASVSRQTVFVEPKEVSPLNNRLRQRQNELTQEIFAVLEDTGRKLRPFTPEIRVSLGILSHWDAIQACARLGQRFSGKPMTVVDDRGVLLRQTAHPLLWWSMRPEDIVRNTMEFGDEIQTLLITGPNTGGKTVFLKTLGMAAIFARTGLPFPATEHPSFPFFESIFADLGDPQSIEQHLSSFSGHVLRFKEILETASGRSLVLIDELNTATDPEEGAALGRAVLETTMARGALIVTTTHDPTLKLLASADRRILNASMEFDEQERTPTYRIAIGIPGRSRALTTAERLGLPREVLDLAKTYLSREHREFESLLSALEAQTQDATKARREAVSLREEAERLRKEWSERTEKSVGELLDRTRQKLRRILDQAQDEVRASVRKLDEQRTRREIDQTRSALNESFAGATREIQSALENEAPEIAKALGEKERKPQTVPDVSVGATVRVQKWKSLGKIVELTGNKAKVALGSLQMMIPVSDLEVVEGAAPARASPQTTEIYEAPAIPPSQIDLRGIRFEEAMAELERYLDLAFRSRALPQVTIVHGLGTGALREGARKLLKDLPYVRTFRDGGAGHGGSGATVVEFDHD